MRASAFTRLWLPGLLLQSAVVGGGYATGRELVEFFLRSGPLGGLLGMVVATLLFSLVSAATFEFARQTRSLDYRTFFKALLGRAWFLYEIGYVVLGLLVIAVIASAAGEMTASRLGIDRTWGTLLLIVPISFLVFRGTALIEKVLAGWSFLLYATYAVLVAVYLAEFGAGLGEAFAAHPPGDGWLVRGAQYVGYNVAILPLILFCVQHMTSRRDALTAGLLAGPLVMMPAVMFFIAMTVSEQAILAAPVPVDYMLQQLDLPWLQALFYVVVFGTFVETGVAFIHALNERVAATLREQGRQIPQWLRPAIAVAAMLMAVILAVRFGIIGLIASGYGTLTWAFILVFVVPLLTIGAWRIFGSGSAARGTGTR